MERCTLSLFAQGIFDNHKFVLTTPVKQTIYGDLLTKRLINIKQ